MNAATLLPDWRAGGRAVTTAHEHAGGLGPLYALRDRNGVELAFVDAGDDGDDDRTLAAFDAAITPGTRLVSISHVLWTTGAVMPVAADRRARPRPRRARRWSTGRRPPAPSRSVSTTSARTCTPSPPRSGCSVRRGWARSSSDPRIDRTVHARARRPVQLRARRQRGRRRVVGRWPPLRVDVASTARRSSGWRARSAGCRCTSGSTSSIGGGWRWPPLAAARLASIPGVTVLTPTHAMATLVTFRIAGWPAQTGARRARFAGLRHRPDDPDPRRAADQRRLLQLRGGARAPRRGGRAARRAHARDAAAAPRPGHPGRVMADRPDPTAMPAAPLVGGGALAPVPARPAPGRAGRGGQPERGDRPGRRVPRL